MSAGNASALRDHRNTNTVIVVETARHLIPAVCFSIVGILGLIVLALWFNDGSRRELLLLGINCVALPPISLNYLLAAAHFSYPTSADLWILKSSKEG